MSEQVKTQEGVDWKKLCLRLLKQIWIIIGAGVAGAVIGSSLYLLIAVVLSGPTEYEITGGFYIEFAEGVLDADDYYNAYTWNSVVRQDKIMNVVMEELAATGLEIPTRETVESMIQADILSDVRYMTVTITGTSQTLDEAVFQAIAVALDAFGQDMKEFAAITQTHCNEVTPVMIPDFTWRAGLLGGLLCFVTALLVLLFLDLIDDSIYVIEDFEEQFQLPLFGMMFRKATISDQTQRVVERMSQELQENLLYACQDKQHVVILPVEDMNKEMHYTVDKWKQMTDACGLPQELVKKLSFVENKKIGVTNEESIKIQDSEGVILAIPYGSHNGKLIAKYCSDVHKIDGKLVGAILIDADAKFIKHYYGTRQAGRRQA